MKNPNRTTLLSVTFAGLLLKKSWRHFIYFFQLHIGDLAILKIS